MFFSHYIIISCTVDFVFINNNNIRRNSCLPQSLSMRSRFFSSSSAIFADDLTPSPDFCDFSTIPQALSTNDGTVSCFSCLGISTNVQYCVSNRITSCAKKNSYNNNLMFIKKYKWRFQFSIIQWRIEKKL